MQESVKEVNLLGETVTIERKEEATKSKDEVDDLLGDILDVPDKNDNLGDLFESLGSTSVRQE